MKVASACKSTTEVYSIVKLFPKLLRAAIPDKLTARLTAVLLITALFSPLFLLESAGPVFAASSTATASSSSSSQTTMPAAPPPAAAEPFVLASSGYFSGIITSRSSAAAAAPIVALNAFVSSGYSSVANYFTAPTLPEGFAMAQPVSPFTASISSTVSSFKSFFGLITPAAARSAAANAVTTNAVASAAAPPPPAAPYAQGTVKFDFTGDGKADASLWHPTATALWKVKDSASATVTTGTLPTGGQIAPADYDGDGKTDWAMFESSGTWTIKRSSDGVTQTITGFGQSGDKPVSGDYTGDGVAELAVWRPSNQTWYVKQISSGTVTSFQFGSAGDIPVPGNYDGDSMLDYAVYRPSTGYWYVTGSQSGFMSAQWGNSSDIPVPADYDGDGKTDYAVYRGGTGTWYIYKSSTNDGSYISQIWGNYGDQPVPADYDGDGKDDIAVWRPTTGVWYTIKSSDSTYLYQTLGMPGDVAAPAAYLKQIGAQVSGYDLAKARLSPKNATGDTDLYSQNFSWGTGLVNLPGRAGMDMGLGLSYNSLVWTKQGSTMVFDADTSNVSPGFRLGFPTIEPSYYNAQASAFAYLMVTPSGRRVEFQQTAVSKVYETADSSHAQLTVSTPRLPQDAVAEATLKVVGTDGTQMFYNWVAGAYRCNKIQDRNGNYITIVNDQYGLLTSITDTLGRTVTVEYDSQFYPTAIKQNWNTGVNGNSSITASHTYATFNYTYWTINPSFDSTILSVYGPQGAATRVLQSVTYADTSSTHFDYNSFGQVYKVSNVAADSSSHVLNYTQFNIASPINQPDCPRFTETRNWVEKFNLNQAGTEQEVVITNTNAAAANYTIGGTTVSNAVQAEVSVTGEATNHHSRTYFAASGWQEGLPLATEDLANENGSSYGQRRWTLSTWTQDNTALSYIQNPRVTDTKVGDVSNVKRTHIDYFTQSGISLPSLVTIYNTDQTTPLKTTSTLYNWDSAYVSRRIIGLPLQIEQSGLDQSTNVFGTVSKMTYAYDGGNFTSDQDVVQNIASVINHDTANYGSGFIGGRGNLTSMTRWNIDTNETITSSVEYDIAGSVVAQITPGSALNTTRKVKIAYADSFNDGGNTRNTFAYPTTLTDPASNSSTVKYRFDIGANVWAQSPAPQSQSQGKTSERIYDTIGRLERQVINNTGAYTRYEYPTNGVQMKAFSTITDGLGEAVSESWTDGAGRLRQSATEMPNSTGGWSGSKTEYDILGQVKRQTVPTEVSVNETTTVLTPAGDDNHGNDAQGSPIWLWNSLEYDWKGRVTRQINTDGTDRLTGYDGCGCAGGQVTTVQSELVPRPDQTNTFGRRTEKTYADILGRTYKMEVLNWDGTIYSTNKTTFNGRDQAMLVRQYAGTDTSSSFQDTTAEYDGFGRTYKTHKPEQQDTSGTATYTTYSYNANDSIHSVADARGATATYTYNDSRGLVTNIDYSGLSSPTTPSLTFGYDNAGNRISMGDGLGNVTYGYDQLSQMTSETRTFSDTLTASAVPSGGFRMEYTYSLGGQLKSYKDPYNREFLFSLDKIGRQIAVTGTTSYSTVSSYSSNYQYRAFGSVKQISYGNQTTATMAYNNRLQPSSYRLNDSTQTLFGKDYYYTTGSNNDNDGLLKSSVHIDNTMTANEQAKRDQLNTYDALDRISSSATGEPGLTPFGSTMRNGPYQQTYSYDAFNNLTTKNDQDFGTNVVGCTGCPRTINYSETITNNRTQSSNYSSSGNSYYTSTYQYDNDGRLINRDGDLAQFDATGKIASHGSSGNTGYETYNYDGDGDLVKWVQIGTGAPFYYYLKSSVFGANMLELDSTGAMSKEYVFSGDGSKLAYLNNTGVIWMHEEPSGKESYQIKQDGTANSKSTYDPTGANATSDGYNGGGACPPYSCYSPQNNAMLAQTNRGFDGLERLTQYRNAEWFQSHQFEIFTTPVGWIRTTTQGDPPKYIPGSGRPHGQDGDGILTPVYVDFISLQLSINFNFSTPSNHTELEKSVDKCATEMFHVSLLGSPNWSAKGNAGKMDFKVNGDGIVTQRTARGFLNKTVSTFSVNINMNYSSNQPGIGYGTVFPGGSGAGIYQFYNKTLGINQFTNVAYIGNDVDSVNGVPVDVNQAMNQIIPIWEALQIHETGNVLSRLTGIYAKAKDWTDPSTGITWHFGVPAKEDSTNKNYTDSDTGMAFELCVLLEYRRLTGL